MVVGQVGQDRLNSEPRTSGFAIRHQDRIRFRLGCDGLDNGLLSEPIEILRNATAARELLSLENQAFRSEVLWVILAELVPANCRHQFDDFGVIEILAALHPLGDFEVEFVASSC
jgi:hypothetical protein